MSEIINLPAGNYWFYGYEGYDIPDNYEREIFTHFLKSLNNLGISDQSSYNYDTGRRNNSGFFYFTYPGKGKSMPGDIHEIHWACSGDYKPHDVERERIKSTHDRISWETLLKGDSAQISSGDFKFSLSPKNIKFKSGKTECSENCIFYYACSGEKNSPLNPSTIFPGISCETHDFSKIHLEW